MVNVLKLAVNGRKRWLPYEDTNIRNSQVKYKLIAKSLYQFRLISHSNDFLIPVPEKSSQKGLLLLSAAGGTAGSCLLNLFEVSNDLGSAFLDGFAVGTHHKAA